MILPTLERKLIDALVQRIITICQVDCPLTVVVDDKQYSVEYKSNDNHTVYVSIYPTDSHTPQIYATIKIAGVI